MVSSSGFGGAASFSVLMLWVQAGSTQSALTKACPCSVAKPFHEGDEVVGLSEHFLRRVLSDKRESCAWSCDALSRIFPS